MYKVFFNDRIVYLGSTIKKSLKNESLEIWANNATEVKDSWIKFMKQKKYKTLNINGKDTEVLKNYFFNIFSVVYAAGGLVNNEKNELLCIYRLGKWDLPKGKIEKGESIDVAALREVREECGLPGILNQGLFSITHHIYLHPKKADIWILKPTYWFTFLYAGNDKPVPQFDEGIIEARWFNKNDIDIVLDNTWDSLKPLIEDWINFG
ncbi:MAG: NUDIX domain-containing protein [Prolixibacteraceae bacterium]|nr:NUDIX domain-containing protein [Prolixibacteraceae bacterium]